MEKINNLLLFCRQIHCNYIYYNKICLGGSETDIFVYLYRRKNLNDFGYSSRGLKAMAISAFPRADSLNTT